MAQLRLTQKKIMNTEPIQVMMLVTKIFNQMEIPYLVGGSLASAIHGVNRTTLDVDLVADIKLNQVDDIIAGLKEAFYLDKAMIKDAIQNKGSFNIIHLDTMFKVDIFLLKFRAFDINQMNRRILHLIGDQDPEKVYFSTAEDIILAKLEWYKNGGEISERQWRDIIGVLSVQLNRINVDDMRKWAKSLGIENLLERALRDVEK
jgi:hypothetical protein